MTISFEWVQGLQEGSYSTFPFVAARTASNDTAPKMASIETELAPIRDMKSKKGRFGYYKAVCHSTYASSKEKGLDRQKEMNMQDLQDGIIIAANDTRRLTRSMDGLDISIHDLWFLNPAYTKEEIILALKDMEDIDIINVEAGIVHIPEHYFI